jgi:hypothetical protein
MDLVSDWSAISPMKRKKASKYWPCGLPISARLVHPERRRGRVAADSVGPAFNEILFCTPRTVPCYFAPIPREAWRRFATVCSIQD